jgi:hypothetical protein
MVLETDVTEALCLESKPLGPQTYSWPRRAREESSIARRCVVLENAMEGPMPDNAARRRFILEHFRY